MPSVQRIPYATPSPSSTCTVLEMVLPGCSSASSSGRSQLHLAGTAAPTSSRGQTKNGKHKRRRNWAPKTRTGCLTCRHRHLKCDETKPYCKRCTSTGRVCENNFDEYAGSVGFLGARRPVRLNSSVGFSHAPPGVHASARERQMFDLMRSLTVKQVKGTFNPPFWSSDVLQAAQTYPVIFHASLSMAAMNHRLRITDAEPQTGREFYAFALEEWNMAISELVKLMAKPVHSYGDRESILLASVLFAGIGCLQKNLKQALMHVTKSMELFNQWRFWLEAIAASPQRSSRGVIDPSWLLHIISYLEFQAHEIDNTIALHSWKRHLYELPRQLDSKRFTSSAEAYYEYVPLHFGSAVEPKSYGPVRVGPDQDDVANFENVYSSWRVRFQQLEKDSAALPPSEKLGVSTLRLLVNCERLCRYLLRSNDPEEWSRHNPRFRDILDVAEQLLDEEHSLSEVSGEIAPTFSFSLSAVEVLRIVGFVSRHGPDRQRAVRLLRKYRRRDGLWDNDMTVALMEAKIALEERSIAEFEATGCGCRRDVFACGAHRGTTVRSDLVGDKAFRTSMNSRAGRARGDADTLVFTRWD